MLKTLNLQHTLIINCAQITYISVPLCCFRVLSPKQPPCPVLMMLFAVTSGSGTHPDALAFTTQNASLITPASGFSECALNVSWWLYLHSYLYLVLTISQDTF